MIINFDVEIYKYFIISYVLSDFKWSWKFNNKIIDQYFYKNYDHDFWYLFLQNQMF